MLQQRRSAAETVAKQLFLAEDALDAAMVAVAGLAGSVPAARKSANLSIMYAQDAVECATETLAHLAQARRTIVATHHALSVAQHQMGLGRVAFGPADEKPETGTGTPPKTGHLMPVKAA
jgi:hypothetical protein